MKTLWQGRYGFRKGDRVVAHGLGDVKITRIQVDRENPARYCRLTVQKKVPGSDQVIEAEIDKAQARFGGVLIEIGRDGAILSVQ